MRTPDFWQGRNNLSNALLPVAWIYNQVSKLRRKCIAPFNAGIPILCVGNLTAGGTGKTPVAQAIGEMLAQKTQGVFFLSKGYGGNIHAPALVDLNIHTAHEVGDEALLLAEILPTIVSKSRVAGAKFAIQQGAKLIIMDDGFQNPTLHKDCSLVVIDAKRGFGNGRILPAGPLREYPVDGLARAQAIILTNVPQSLPSLPAEIPVFTATANFASDVQKLKGKKYVAFSGIAYPDKFFDTLAALEASVVEKMPFPDHYFFSDSDIAKLQQSARIHNATLITTAKDAVRLSAEIRSQVEILPIKMAINNPERLIALLEKFLPL